MTSPFPEPGRLAAHVLLDAASVWDDDDPEASGRATNLALTVLSETGAVEVRDDTVVVDNLAGAAISLIHWLLELATAFQACPCEGHDGPTGHALPAAVFPSVIATA